MNCDEYLATLSTASLGELEAGPGRDHAARCPDCDRVTRLIAERERHRVAAFDDLRSSVPAYVTSDAARATVPERGVDRGFTIGVVLAVAVSLWLVVPRIHFGGRELERAARAADPIVEDALLLRCLTAGQAAALIRPHIRDANSSVVASAHAPGVITIRGTAAQIARARAVLRPYEGEGSLGCAVGGAAASPR
jgi:hypothetical protein